MFTLKSPPSSGFRKSRGRPKQHPQDVVARRVTYCSWYDWLFERGLLSAEYARLGESYSYLRRQVLNLQNVKPKYRRSAIFKNIKQGCCISRTELSLLQQQRLLRRWQLFEDVLLVADKSVLDFCTVEPLNYHWADWQLKELGVKVHQALTVVAYYKDKL